MTVVLFTFVAVFLLIASGGLLLFYREAMLDRISAVIQPGTKERTTLLGAMQQTGASFGGMVERLESVVPKSKAEVSVQRKRLIRAGYRSDAAVRTFYGAKIAVPVLLALFLLAIVRTDNFFLYIAALGVGFLLPDFWLGNRIKARQKRIRMGLPDALDMMVICIEAGLGVDQATARTARELSKAQPAVTDELGMVVLEQHAGRPRAEAWRNFAERCGVDSVKNLVTVLVQSEQFGTSIAKTLRVHSDVLRTQRRQRVEEQAAKTTVKLVFPLVLFIFPSIFVVTIGPAILMIIDNFKHLNQ
jgi:tight adherence protein C